MIPTQKKLRYGSKKALKFRGASLLKIVTVEYSEDAGCGVGARDAYASKYATNK